jgi:NADH-quinone oxidoreductase subunit L
MKAMFGAQFFRGRRWQYVVLTGLLSGAVGWWAYPKLNTYVFGWSSPVLGHDVGPAWPSLSLDTLVIYDNARVMMLAAVVAFLVQLYSAAYLKDDRRYRSYAVLIMLFLVAMVAVVATDNLFVLLIGWEVMGVCSYLLIGHHWERDDAQSGAAKALLVTRIADIGLLVAILVIGQTYGTYSIMDAWSSLSEQGAKHSTLIGLLLIVAICGKSAQLPLQTWLPDAMPGPTPITALIHAATMVAAGVYVMGELLPFYEESTVAMTTLAVVAGLTMLSAALFALAQLDLKRALAWSTVSQLAYMYAAIAVGSPKAANDHLISHGVFKALLFLGCGIAMHAVGSSALSAMGGLRTSIPATFWTMTIGFAALAGLAPTVGFLSKDEVLSALHHGSKYLPDGVTHVLLACALLTSVVTAAYSTRLWYRAFLGKPQARHKEPWLMVIPVVLLALATLALPPAAIKLGRYELHWGIGIISTVAAVLGIALAMWLRNRGLRARYGRPFERELGWDAVFSRFIPGGTLGAARAVAYVDESAVDSYPRGGALTAQGVSWVLDRFQTAKAQVYATAIAGGALLLVVLGIVVGR